VDHIRPINDESERDDARYAFIERFINDEKARDDVRRAFMRDPERERQLHAMEQALLKGVRKEIPPLQILLRGLDIQGDEKERIESEIRQVVVEEIITEERARLRGVPVKARTGRASTGIEKAIEVSLGG
jgi:hypothetical protein